MAKTKLDLITEKSFSLKPYSASDAAELNAEKNRADCEKRAETIGSNPYRVRLELTNECNLNCVFCYRSHFRTDDKSLLTPEDIDRLDPALRTAKHISLVQKAESLMSPHFLPILEKMAAYDAVLYLCSNGQKLTDEVSRALIRNKVTFLTISANIFDEEYAKVYRGGDYDVLERNIARLVELKKEAGSDLPRLRLSFVLREDTLPYLDDAVSFAAKYDFSEGVQVLSYYSFVEEDRHLEPALHWHKYEREVERVRSRAETLNVPMEFSHDVLSGMRPKTTGEYVSQCVEPWEAFNVTPGGNVFACCGSAEPMGNIRETAPLDIWNGEQYRKFRKGMNVQPYNEDCENCWHVRFVAPEIIGTKVSQLDRIYDTFYRRRKAATTAVDLNKKLPPDGDAAGRPEGSR